MVDRDPEFWLQIVFKSNERPWRHSSYKSGMHGPMDRGIAVYWARRMQNRLGEDYQVTLYEDGQVIEYDEAQQKAAQGASQLQQNAAIR